VEFPRRHFSDRQNFHSETKIAGFITKKDVILGGLRQGAIFGSLFGSALALLSGVECCSPLSVRLWQQDPGAALLARLVGRSPVQLEPV